MAARASMRLCGKAGPGRKSWRLHRSWRGGRGTLGTNTLGLQARGPRLHPEDTQAKEGAQLSNSSGWSVRPQLEAGTLEPECSSRHRLEALRRMTRGLANLKEHPRPGDMDSVSRCSPRPDLGLSQGSRGTAAWLTALRGHGSHPSRVPRGCL